MADVLAETSGPGMRIRDISFSDAGVFVPFRDKRASPLRCPVVSARIHCNPTRGAADDLTGESQFPKKTPRVRIAT
jgi:hypothetical protein